MSELGITTKSRCILFFHDYRIGGIGSPVMALRELGGLNASDQASCAQKARLITQKICWRLI
jgi:hypothetical protein